MPTLLHVGCNAKRKNQTTAGFGRPEWTEIRLDIDPSVEPDIVANMLDMAAVPTASVDGLFSSHNIEHLYLHEVETALREFRRVLKPGGFAVITCPDLQSMAELVVQDRLHEAAYVSPAGPVTPHDTLYGYGPALARGHLFMAHRCGFTQRSLHDALRAAGFGGLGLRRQAHCLWAVAVNGPMEEAGVRQLIADHFPQR
jgi:hypothetical protein